LRCCGTLRPVTPDSEQPFRLADMAGPPRRPTQLIIGGAAAVLACLVIAGVAFAVTSRQQEPMAGPSPTPSVAPTAASAVPAGAASTASAWPTASPPRTPGETCSNSAAWDHDGGTSLIDAYINNQDSGNVVVEDIKAECPQYLPVWQKAQGGIPDGSSFAVPAEVKPGTYETTSSDLESCYWERSRNGEPVDNRFITASKVKQRVTIRSTDDTFVTRKCGNWIRVS
jgi:hypothetical protein